MHEAVVGDAHVHEDPEGGGVRDQAGAHHARLQVFQAPHVGAVAEGHEGPARVAAAGRELGHHAIEGAGTEGRAQLGVVPQGGSALSQQIGRGLAQARRAGLEDGVPFGMNARPVERVGGVAHHQECGRLLEGLVVQQARLVERGARGKRPLRLAPGHEGQGRLRP